MATACLTESLLAEHTRGRDLQREEVATPSCSSTCPPSFKASKRRKSKAFIGSEKSNSRFSFSPCSPHAPEAIDPRLSDDAHSSIISEKVAFFIVRHIQEAIDAGLELSSNEDDFHETHFLYRSCFRRCCPRSWLSKSVETRASHESVLEFISSIVSSLFFCKQVVVLCAIYIERLLDESKVQQLSRQICVTHGNWRTMVIAGLLLSSKVWEDIHPWNADFEECLLDAVGVHYAPGALYRLESLFLEKLRWKVFVDAKDYAAYYFSLLESRGKVVGGMRRNDSDDGLAFRPRRRTRRRVHTDVDIIPAINEDEVYHTIYERVGDSDMERSETCTVASSPKTPSAGDLWDSWDSSGSDASGRIKRVASWQQSVLDGDGGGILTSSALRDAWSLDASNPHLGSLRHAPRASAPSRHILPNAETRWAKQLATRTAEVLGPRRFKGDQSTNTISGATGVWLNSELQRHRGLGKISEGIPLRQTSPASPATPMTTLGDLSFDAEDVV